MLHECLMDVEKLMNYIPPTPAPTLPEESVDGTVPSTTAVPSEAEGPPPTLVSILREFSEKTDTIYCIGKSI